MNQDISFTDTANSIFDAAQSAAAEMGHSYVGSEHLLLGLLRSKGTSAFILKSAGLSEVRVFDILTKKIGCGKSGELPVQGLTACAVRIVENSIREAIRFEKENADTEHVLLGVLREYGSTAVQCILAAGIETDRLYGKTVNICGKREETTYHVKIKTNLPKHLAKYGRDLTAAAAKGEIDPVIGRENELLCITQILIRRTKNNPLIIGAPGVGKTAAAEGMARLIAAGDVPRELSGKRIVSLDISSMLAGAKYRGDFEARMKTVLAEAGKQNNIILFIDEIQLVIGAGTSEGTMDAANMLKPALGRAEVQIIGTATLKNYEKYIKNDAAFERRFRPVLIGEPTCAEAVKMLKGVRGKYEAYHNVLISDEVIEAAVALSSKYITARCLPDKAIDLIDEASARIKNML